MNDRIKELAEQSTDKWVGGEFFDREKFAGLIVQECIDLVKMTTMRDGRDTVHYKQSQRHIEKIKEHFGIVDSEISIPTGKPHV